MNLALNQTQICLWIATLAKLARNDGRHGKIRYFIVAPRFDFIKARNDKQRQISHYDLLAMRNKAQKRHFKKELKFLLNF